MSEVMWVWDYELKTLGSWPSTGYNGHNTPVEVVTQMDVKVLRDERDRLKREKDGAYLERNRVVAALAKLFPSGIARTAIEGWSEDWHGCVYIDLPTGQVSWHYHDSHAHLFAGIPPYPGTWDGHSTEEKYQRVTALTPAGGGKK